jgi:hypothetical protein
VGKSYPCILSGNKSVHSLRYFVLTGAFWIIFSKVFKDSTSGNDRWTGF